MNPFEPATLGARRYAARALSGVRSAPYLRKWLILGTLIGVVAGLGAVVFYDGLNLASRFLLTDIGGYTPGRTAGEGGYQLASGFSRPWAIPLVVAGGALAAGLLVFGLAPEAEGHGTDAAIKAVHANPKGVRPRVIVVKLIASMLTIGSGGSGGREGPTAQISSGFGSVLSRTLNLTPADSRICVASGIASGIGAIFRAPFGGALLGVELLYTNDVEIEALLPSLVSTVVGYAIFGAITGNFSPIFGDHSGASVGHAWELALFIVVGLACGLVGKLYTSSFYWLTDRFNRWSIPRGVKPAVAGLVVGAIGLGVPGVLGTGYGEVQAQLDLHHLLTMPLWVVLVLPFAKLVATGLSIGSGGSGGIFGPGMVVGGATGAMLWRVGHLVGLAPHNQVAFVVVGMAACFGAIAHAPVAVLLMVAEMTGSLGLLPPAMVAVAFATLVVGDTTIYRSQLRRRADSPAHRFDFGLPQPAAVAATAIMSKPRLVVASATPGVAALEQIRAAGVPGAPVVNADGAFIGSLQAATLAHLVEEGDDRSAGRVADVEAMTLPEEAGLDAVIDALPASKGGWVPVLDDDMRVIGIISTTDLVRGWRHTMQRSVRRITQAATSTTAVEGVVEASSKVIGQPISALALPKGAVIVSTLRGETFLFPDAGQVLEEGDVVTVLVRAADVDTVRVALGLRNDATSRPPGPEAASASPNRAHEPGGAGS
ncbi:chloride channel protein [Acidiferrimicrobium sp. IK]|uniref:chloride channel protein n=1 Tax=Acidiferrimicrobium sp. IK TaxID=2871700 RepID=UPI0021CB3704|nr:chloride channel protein [Acidiferrimicrobium sp. IK]MCU4186404.1 chloride channel protein [Acidiferrimicrobium sp. IK]